MKIQQGILALMLCMATAVCVAGPPVSSGQGDPTITPESLQALIANPGRTPVAEDGVAEITIDDSGERLFAEAKFIGVPLGRVCDMVGRAANMNVVSSRSLAEERITITLRNIELAGLLDAIAVSHGMVVRHDPKTAVYLFVSPDEIRGDLSPYQSVQTEVFTLLYPNASDVIRVIDNVYGDRVIVSYENQFYDEMFEDLQNRFRRFDAIEGRSRGLSGSVGGGTIRTGTRGSDVSRRESQRVTGGIRPSRLRTGADDTLAELTSEELRTLVEAEEGVADAIELASRMASRRASTHVASVQRLNRIIVHSADPQLLDDIRRLIQRLDVPTPLVLLEVRVLRIDLSDGLDSAVEFAFQAGDAQGSFSGGEIGTPPAGSILPGGSGINLSAGLFQIVSDNFQARMQLLQSKGRVTSLATPVLLTAHGEVSRIFSGEQIPIVVGFTEPRIITGDGATTTLAATPVTELRDVGTDLLITANINADRTVSLRLLQETSSINKDGASILVPVGSSFTARTVDTVRSQSASGTVVARDGMLLAFGGLIEESTTDSREQLPVLGDIPLIGFLFRRESSLVRRSELVVLIRPFVLSTPIEGDDISRSLLDSLSVHPYRPQDGVGSGNRDDLGIFREEQPSFDRSVFDAFRFHTAPSLNRGMSDGEIP